MSIRCDCSRKWLIDWLIDLSCGGAWFCFMTGEKIKAGIAGICCEYVYLSKKIYSITEPENVKGP